MPAPVYPGAQAFPVSVKGVAVRHASGLTQQQLADLLGYDRTYISMIECGRRTVTDRGPVRNNPNL